MRPLLALVVLAVLAVLPAPTPAATVELGYDDECRGECGAVLAFVASAPERNDVSAQWSVQRPEGDFAVVVSDSRAVLHAGRDCDSLDPHTVGCTTAADYIAGGTFFLGKRDDRLTVQPLDWPVYEYGGSGRDVLAGGPAGDQIFGGAGDDALHGKAGGDSLSGGPGNDALDGGEGADFAEYETSRRGLRVDLAAGGPQGLPGSRDVFRGIENVSAPRARGAQLRGDARRNWLSAGPRSRVYGRAGNDFLHVNYRGRVYGGPGDDGLNSAAQGRHKNTHRRFECGPGRDRAIYVAMSDLIRPSCERIVMDTFLDPEYLGFDPRPGPGRPITRLAYDCPRRKGCLIDFAARLGSRDGPYIARRRVRVPYDGGSLHYERVKLFLTDAGRAALSRRRRARAVVYFRDGPQGDFHPTWWPPLGFSAILRGGG